MPLPPGRGGMSAWQQTAVPDTAETHKIVDFSIYGRRKIWDRRDNWRTGRDGELDMGGTPSQSLTGHFYGERGIHRKVVKERMNRKFVLQ